MIVFCGYANSDVTVRVPEMPAAGSRINAHSIVRHDGGMAANAAFAAAKAGAATAFAGVVGGDALSDAFLGALSRAGADVSWTARDGRLTSAVVLVGPDGERTIISQDDDVDAAHIAATARGLDERGGGLLYLDGYRFPQAGEALAGLRAVRCAVDLDGCTDPGAARVAARLADHVIAGPWHAALLGPDPAEAAAEHHTTLVVTDGPRGWRLFTPGGSAHSGPAVPVATADTTGAGDCFTGSYLARIDRGDDPVTAARYAAAAASLSCTAIGARDGIPCPDRVLALLEQ
ncbi:carbohydrate kinase family protein [Saccharomonospora sp. NPDC006951]